MYVGLSKCSGDYIVVMDVDLQHPPELLKEMYSLLETEDYDCVTARRVSRKGEPVIRSACSRTFYKIYKRLTGIEMIQGSTDYRMMKRKVADAIVSMSERERFTKGIYSWIGFKNKWIEYENVERAAGKTKWSMRGLFKYAINGFVAFATTPLRSVIYLGMLVVAFSFIYAITLIITMLNSPATARTGYASIIILMLFLGGVIITILGVIGEYLARIYMEVKQRPIYIISESNIDEIPKNSI